MREIGLDTLLTTRPSLRPGEVVTVLASVARELAGMHAAGRAHGALTTAAVVLDPAGRPRLLHPPPPRSPVPTPGTETPPTAAPAPAGTAPTAAPPPTGTPPTAPAPAGTPPATPWASPPSTGTAPDSAAPTGSPTAPSLGAAPAAPSAGTPPTDPVASPASTLPGSPVGAPPTGMSPINPAPTDPAAPTDSAAPTGSPTDPAAPTAPAARAPSVGAAEGDVRALAALGRELVGPYPPERLVLVLHEAASGVLTARAVAAKALAACRPEPVRRPPAADAEGGGGLPQPPPSRAGPGAPPWERAAAGQPAESGEAPRIGAPIADRGPAGRRRIGARDERPATRVVEWSWRLRGALARRRRTLTVVLVAVVLGGLAAGWSLAASPDAARPGTATPAPADWRGRLEHLDRLRATAYARGDPDALGDVYVPGSRALADDAGTLRAYRRAGLRVRGLRLRITAVRPVATSDREATLAVTDRLAAYQVVDADGQVVRTRPGRPATTWQVTLRRLADGWRIAAIEPSR